MALKDQTKRAKPLGCRNDVIGLIKVEGIGKNSFRRFQGKKKGGRQLPPFGMIWFTQELLDRQV